MKWIQFIQNFLIMMRIMHKGALTPNVIYAVEAASYKVNGTDAT